MATQMSSARRGIATDEMKQVAKDEDVTLDWLLPKIAIGSIIIPSNNVRPQKIHNVGIGKGMKTKVNVNIGTSTLNVNVEEEVEKAKVAVKYHADTIMDLSDGGDVGSIRRTLLDAAPITFGTVPIYEAYNFGVEKHKNPLDITEDDYIKAFENNIKDGVDYTTIHSGITKEIAKRDGVSPGVDVIFEHIGGSHWNKELTLLKYGSTIVTTGATTGYDVPTDLRHIFFKGINILGSTQGTRAELEAGFHWMGQGKIKAVIDSVFTLENAVEAHKKMLNGKGLVGKIILKPN